MTPFDKISKLNELKEKLKDELTKEVKDNFLINRLQGQIIQLGLTLTSADVTKRRYG